MKERRNSIYVRVTSAEKVQITHKAIKCGLSVSEYIRQRCLGYAPREMPPEVYYRLCQKLDDVKNDCNANAVLAVLDELRQTLVEPGRDG